MQILGRILDIDLTNKRWCFSPFPEDLIWKCLGGRGFNAWYLFHHLSPTVDPLGPENILIFSDGVLTGTAAPAASRMNINAISPQTGLLGSSNVGGDFGAELRSCNIQTLIIRGQSIEPVYLWIDGDTVEIRDARPLWGLDTWKTQDRIKASNGHKKVKTLAIGPGAENGALFGCMMVDRDHAAGRTGMGTVMGSKNLKAIALQAQKKKGLLVSNHKTHEAIKQYVLQMKNSPHFEATSKYGGAGYVQWADELGILATHNYRENRFDAAAQIDGKHLEKNITRTRGCLRCPVQCKAELEFKNKKFKGGKAIRPEFESMLSLGSKCGLRDLETLVYLDNLCSRLGIDTISAGNSIAFAMDLYDRGILTLVDTGGIDLFWGNGEAMETLIRQIGSREGFGAILSQGVRNAAKVIGRGSERFAAHVKGLEMSGYHPYSIMGTALGYAVASRGADFNDIYATLEYKWLPEKADREFGTPEAVNLQSIKGKALLVRRAMIVGVVLDSLGLCKVPALCLICKFDLESEAELVSALTGQPINGSELFRIGERIINLERLFNLRQGAGSKDDRLPDMFFDKEYNSGRKPSKPREWMEPMKQEFYHLMGWNRKGVPTRGKLEELSLFPSPCPAESAA